MSKLQVVSLAALGALLSSQAWGTGDVPRIITQDTTLTEDRTGAIVIGADEITLNCGGHAVIGTGPGSGNGIELISIVGATVTNCRVRNFDRGFYLEAARTNLFISNEANNNFMEGFEIEESNANTFIDNQANQNGRDGVDIDDSHSNIFIENEANDNDLNGFELDRSNHNVFTSNIANGNGRPATAGQLEFERSGFSLETSVGNFLFGNTANDNRRNGFRLGVSWDNTLIENMATGNLGQDAEGIADRADCKQVGLESEPMVLVPLGEFVIRNRFMDNQFTNPDACEFFRPQPVEPGGEG